MIPIGTQLTPRDAADPVVTVGGIEGQRYVLQPIEFASPFSMGYDELSASYDCADHTLQIEEYDEAREWRKLSSERFHGVLTETRRQAHKQKADSSPEQVFAAAAAES
jgi:hypothetical protein